MFEQMSLIAKKNLFIRASDLYHRGHESPLTDADFDELKRILKEEISDWPPLKMTGVPPLPTSPLTKVKHVVHMGSIANAMNETEFATWYKSMESPLVTANLKVDGASMILTYEDGELKRAATRGDGIHGEDVTHHAIRMKNVPLFIKYTGTLYVRGEAVMMSGDWMRYNKEVPEAKNARNSTAGMLGRKDSNYSQYISFLAHHVWFGEEGNKRAPGYVGESYHDQMQYMQEQGFILPTGGKIANLETAKEWFLQIETARAKAQLGYEIDGIVFIVDDQQKWRSLGINGENCPRGSIAWKFTAMTGKSRLVSVEHRVGNNGQVTPVGIVEPVMIGGVTVTQASLANYVLAHSLDVGIGEEVEVSRRGDVIPKIERRIGGYAVPRVLIQEPTECPVCGTPLVRNKLAEGGTGSITLCPSDECGAKPAGLINRWRKSIDIKEIGDEVIEALIFTGLAHTPAELYKLKEISDEFAEMMVNGKKLGKSKADKIITNIEAKRNLTVDEILGSLSVPGLGVRKVQLIREAAIQQYGAGGHFLDALPYWFTETCPNKQSILQQYAEVLGIKNAWRQIQEGLDKRKPLVDDLLAAGVTVRMPDAPVAVAADAKLAGQSFCFTECRPTDEESAKLVALGAREASGVSKKLTALVVALPETMTGKVQKAKQDGISIITYKQFQELLNA